MTDALHMLLDHTNLTPIGHVGGRKWLEDEAKTMPCTFMTLSYSDSGTPYMPL